MGRKRFEKTPKDPRGGHIRLYFDMYDSPAFRVLSWPDQALYLALRRRLLGSNNGNINATLGSLREAGFSSSATLFRSLRALQSVGLIEKTRQGGIAAGGKECNLFRFTDVDVFEHPKQGIKAMKATNEWKQWTSVHAAKAALAAAHAAALRPSTQVKRKVQEMKQVDSQPERLNPVLDSAAEQVASQCVHPLNTVKDSQTSLKAA